MIGDKLRDLRTNHNLTQRELADTLGVHHTYISKIERSKAQPSAQFIRNCVRVLGVRMDDLRRGPTVTRRDDGRVTVRIHFVDSTITDGQAVELARELMRVATGATDEPCARCGERPRMWVQGVHCSTCIAESLREALMGSRGDD